jgi:hypothetical protein
VCFWKFSRHHLCLDAFILRYSPQVRQQCSVVKAITMRVPQCVPIVITAQKQALLSPATCLLAAMLFHTQACWRVCGVAIEPLDGNPATWGPSGEWTNWVFTSSYPCAPTPPLKAAKDCTPGCRFFQKWESQQKFSGSDGGWPSNSRILGRYNLEENKFVPTFRRKCYLHIKGSGEWLKWLGERDVSKNRKDARIVANQGYGRKRG